MSRDPRDPRKGYYNRDWERDRDRDRNRDREYRLPLPKRSRSPLRDEKRRSRSPRVKVDKDLDENILSEISKLPEPSELWEPNQFPEPGFAPPPPSFQPPDPNPSYNSYPAQSYSGIYDDFPPVATVPPTPHPPDINSWNQLSLPPPPTVPPQFNVEEQIKKEAAIESEMRHQKAALSKQREDYMKKAGILKKELETLKDQRNELRGDPKRSPSPDTKRFLKENTKLQLEIQNKLKTINNVVDMLNGIIGEEAAEAAPDSDDSSPDHKTTKRKSRSPTGKKFNYVYYDPEMHWCRVCNEFPPTAKDYLNHLHSPAHQKMAAAHMEAPWHSVTTANEGFPSFPSAPTKRTPIRGLQFFVPSTAWYCKLCDQFIGDLHCASAHLKSIVHSKNYTNFVEQNPHWETDWMSDRQKAFEKARGTKVKREEEPKNPQAVSRYAAHTITFNKDGFHTKRKDSPPPPVAVKEEKKKKKKDKKKKSKKKKEKSSSSSSSSSNTSSDSDAASKKKKKKLLAHIAEARLNESDRQLLDSLKSRMTRNREADRDARERDDRGASRKREAERSPRGERRSSRGRSPRPREREREREHEHERDHDRRSASRAARSPARKPDVRKMPFIGKMPVYKNLTKTTKTEDQKKEDVKRKEEDEATKKRRDEMDAEIQKKELPVRVRALLAERFGAPRAPTVQRLLLLLDEQCRPDTPPARPTETAAAVPPATPLPSVGTLTKHTTGPPELTTVPPKESEIVLPPTNGTLTDHNRTVTALPKTGPPVETIEAVKPMETVETMGSVAAMGPPMWTLAAMPSMGQIGTMPPMGPMEDMVLLGPMGAMSPMRQMGPMPPMGPMGAIPPIGPMGAMPPMGPMGAIPPMGPMGEIPPMGPMGEIPPMGPMGAMPPMGPMGAMGEIPPMGPMGEMPPMGPMGEIPPMGPMGEIPPMGPMGEIPPMGPMGKMPPMGAMPPTMGPMIAMPPMGPQPDHCLYCQKKNHFLPQCRGFLRRTPLNRKTWAKRCYVCGKCLRRHPPGQCGPFDGCTKCHSNQHNTLLCHLNSNTAFKMKKAKESKGTASVVPVGSKNESEQAREKPTVTQGDESVVEMEQLDDFSMLY